MDTTEHKRAQMREIRNRFIALHKERGLCTECSNIPEEGNLRCAPCLLRRAKKQKEHRIKVLAEGRYCKNCLRQLKLPSNSRCADCYFRRVSHTHFGTETLWKELKKIFELQNGKCALSGVILTLGVDAELDHITPSSRKGKDDLANVQWVLCVVNRMKDHLLESEFFGLVEKLYHTMKEHSVSSPYNGGDFRAFR